MADLNQAKAKLEKLAHHYNLGVKDVLVANLVAFVKQNNLLQDKDTEKLIQLVDSSFDEGQIKIGRNFAKSCEQLLKEFEQSFLNVEKKK